MKPQSFIFIGRAGAGKGTQAKLLIEELKRADQSHEILYVETGSEFRKIAAGDNFTAKQTKLIVDSGKLMPIFMCVYAWGDIIVQRFTGNEHMILDGTPRKLEEAKMLESVFPFFVLPKPWVVYLDIDHEETKKRIKIRSQNSGRADDNDESLERRRSAYEEDVKPTVEWYRSHGGVNFLDIDGERSIEDVHADIVKMVGLV